ncbi:HicA-like toxin of HicAB toxin-antitoxin system [Anaerobacterium chartisolvens]|uniref:HicA-like toxin of HicAB toxin-antitoxin system n=1 Tax=Anaerobacterium chartisolvens TaxID=1297424 RepID=A0A369AVR3_9FIRM|nr:type II toxin-antitoxin system HicA family toxin [Anaerobacterium chartisolvens]RCX12326.1 HicA-like toxin of HicAB toxin-antitoxin system [Anaerobacterium chartisolvens]
MGQFEKILIKILCGTKDNYIDFNDLCKVLKSFEFKVRTKGSHHIFYKDGIAEIINIQPDGSRAKPYQVKQVRHIILKYKMGGAIDA